MPLSEQHGTIANGRPCWLAYSTMMRVAPSGCMPTNKSHVHGSVNVNSRCAYFTSACFHRLSNVTTSRPRPDKASLSLPMPPAMSNA